MDASFDADPIVVEVVRNGFVESVHRGRIAVTSAQGDLVAWLGAKSVPLYPRSASKPLQAVGMLRTGLDLEGELLALVSASHAGEAFHQDGVRRILTGCGLDEAALQTPLAWPSDELAMQATVRSGGRQSSIAMNCSGKHAGMLRTAVMNGWSTTDYRKPDHPVQVAILRTIQDLAGERPSDVAVDGCGAPLFAISLVALARAFGRMAAATSGHEAEVANAIRQHPEYTSGTHRDEFDLHRALPGIVAKAGAEAVYAVGLPDGRGVAVKVTDGSPRAQAVLMAGVLTRLGFEHDVLVAQASAPVLGHGVRVGEIRPTAALARL